MFPDPGRIWDSLCHFSLDGWVEWSQEIKYKWGISTRPNYDNMADRNNLSFYKINVTIPLKIRMKK